MYPSDMPKFLDQYHLIGLDFTSILTLLRDKSAVLTYRKCSPDEGALHRVFLKVKHAYDVLSDLYRRAHYDEYYLI